MGLCKHWGRTWAQLGDNPVKIVITSIIFLPISGRVGVRVRRTFTCQENGVLSPNPVLTPPWEIHPSHQTANGLHRTLLQAAAVPVAAP